MYWTSPTECQKVWKKHPQRGYTGSDKVLAVGAEISKKALNYALTKNPVVGLGEYSVGQCYGNGIRQGWPD